MATWDSDIAERIAALAALPENWNTYGSCPISAVAVQVAQALAAATSALNAPRPDVVPVGGGGIQFEWCVAPRELEIHIYPDGTMSCLTDEQGAMDGWDFDVRNTELLEQRIAWLNGTKEDPDP